MPPRRFPITSNDLTRNERNGLIGHLSIANSTHVTRYLDHNYRDRYHLPEISNVPRVSSTRLRNRDDCLKRTFFQLFSFSLSFSPPLHFSSADPSSEAPVLTVSTLFSPPLPSPLHRRRSFVFFFSFLTAFDRETKIWDGIDDRFFRFVTRLFRLSLSLSLSPSLSPIGEPVRVDSPGATRSRQNCRSPRGMRAFSTSPRFFAARWPCDRHPYLVGIISLAFRARSRKEGRGSRRISFRGEMERGNGNDEEFNYSE